MTSSLSFRNRYTAISTPRGAFAMVAMDQRESLRTMMAARTSDTVESSQLVDFKLAVVSRLSPHASALLIDTQWGLAPVLQHHALDGRCGLIVAADALDQSPGEPVEDTTIDRSVDPQAMAALGASALKLLVIWRDTVSPALRADLIGQFVDVCHDAGLLALVEPVVRPPTGDGSDWDREEAILEAAREIGPLGVDVYKAEVPFHGRGDPAAITARCREISAVLPCPWVVLSQGVDLRDFPTAVEAACRGGASGFLAGRAIWSDTLSSTDYRTEIQRVSVPRLQTLRNTVDRLARPWQDVLDQRG